MVVLPPSRARPCCRRRPDGVPTLDASVHRMRPCVQAHSAAVGIFIDPLVVSGQLVPGAIEVDALPALHQTSSSRPRKIEVQQQRLLTMLVPIAYSGQRCHRSPPIAVIRPDISRGVVPTHSLHMADSCLTEVPSDLDHPDPLMSTSWVLLGV